MPYQIINNNGQTVNLPVRVRPAEDHRVVYAHGAQGGALGNYHFRIDFYQDVMPPTEYTEGEGGAFQPETVSGVDRQIGVSVYVPLPFLKELADWLGKNVQQLENQFGEIRTLQSIVQSDEAKIKKA